MTDPISASGRAFHTDRAWRRTQEFLTNAHSGDNAANDELVQELDPDPGDQPRDGDRSAALTPPDQDGRDQRRSDRHPGGSAPAT